MKDQDMPDELFDTITALFHDPTRLFKMANSMRRLAYPGAAKKIGKFIISISKKGGKSTWSV